MSQAIYRVRFESGVPFIEIQGSLLLAIYASEAIHGPAQMRLDAAFFLDEEKRTCLIEGATMAGRTIAQIFTGFLVREFGEDAITVERLVEPLRTNSAEQST